MKGAISCLFYGTLAYPAPSPAQRFNSSNISRGNRLTVLRLWDWRRATPFYAGRLLVVSPVVVWEFLGGCRAEFLEFRTSAWESRIG